MIIFQLFNFFKNLLPLHICHFEQSASRAAAIYGSPAIQRRKFIKA